MSHRFTVIFEREEEGGYDVESTTVSLMCGVVQRCENVFSFQKWIICKDLLKGSSGAKQFQNVRYTDAGAASAFAYLNDNPLESLQAPAL